MIHAEFAPKNLEKAIDMARHIATFGHLIFSPSHIQVQITDPAKVLHLDMILVPDVYKVEKGVQFGVNLQMLYKLIRSLDGDDVAEIEADECVMKIAQGSKLHTLIHQDIHFPVPDIISFTGPKVTLPTKLFQKYIRAIGNIAPAFELHYSPRDDLLSMESVNSMYRTRFSLDTGVTPNADADDEYRKNFLVKFVELAINPALSDKIELTMGETLVIGYEKETLTVLVTIAAYTDA